MDYGTEPFKLVRADDPETSHAAAEAVDSVGWEERMHRFITQCGVRGGTPKEALAAYPGFPYSTITARFKALKEKGLIVPTGEVRERSAVLVDARLMVDENGQMGWYCEAQKSPHEAG